MACLAGCAARCERGGCCDDDACGNARRATAVQSADAMSEGRRDQGAAAMQPCPAAQRCPACTTANATAPTLFTRLQIDGVGVIISHLLWPIAYAAFKGFNFGGAISKRRRHSRDHVLNPKDESHGLSRATAIQFAFGTAEPPVVVDSVVKRDPHMIKVKTIAELDKLDAARLPPNTHILCDAEDFDHVTRLVKDANRKPVSAEAHFFHPDSRFVEALYDGVACALRQYAARMRWAKDRPRVALHVRRGDVDEAMDRWVSNEHYYAIVESIRRLVPDADVHVFSETYPGMSTKKKVRRAHPSSEFEGFRQRGMTVHLDGDPLLAWAHFATSNIFVQGKSSFSVIGGGLNPHCTISAYPVDRRATQILGKRQRLIGVPELTNQTLAATCGIG